jgi:hypothetical protein
MAWTELRSSAVIGTGRRAHLPDAVDGHPITADRFASTEERALAAAALLGTQRRAGMAATPGSTAAPEPADPDEAPLAPIGAVQLLDLALAGNLGRPSDSNVLVAQWLRTATARGLRVPHRLLVGVLTRATSAPDLRDPARAAIGRRGRWLAAQRSDWTWATVDAVDPDDLAAPARRFATATGAERRDLLQAVRATDPAAGRQLLADTWDQERAAERATLIGCLAVGLGPDDDPFLEGALDDKAKTVREAAATVLDRLPTSARAARLRAVLLPLIDHSGLLRKRLTLAPLPEGTDLARDLPGSVPSSVRRDLVRAAPLAAWTEVTGLGPDGLAKVTRDPDDLLAWWVLAATAQHDERWALALGLATASPPLLQLIAGPWTPDLSGRVVAALRAQKGGVLALARAEDLLIERLHPSAVADLDAWRRALTDEDRNVEVRLRHIIQLVTTRSSITEAFS